MTDDTEVFLVSPRTKKEQRKKKDQERARASREPNRLAAVGLSRVVSVPSTPLKRFSNDSSDAAGLAEEAAFGDLGVGLGASELRSNCSDRGRTHSALSSVADTSPAASESCSESDSEEDPEELLDDGIKRRAGEQMMVQNLKLLAVKYRQYGGAPRGSARGAAMAGGQVEAETESPGRARAQAQSAAENFNIAYSRTLGIFQSNMTLSPPRRRHSVTFGELRPYASTCGSSICGESALDGPPTPLSESSGLGERHGSRQSARRRSLSIGSLCRTPSFHSVMEEMRPGYLDEMSPTVLVLTPRGSVASPSFCLGRSSRLPSSEEVQSVEAAPPRPAAPSAGAPADVPSSRASHALAIEAIMEAFSGLDSCVDGRLPQEDFGLVLMTLEPEVWTSAAVSKLLSAMRVDASGQLDLAEALAWIFGGC